MADERAVLGASVDRLRALVEPFGATELRAKAYPTEWTVADVLSHIGSGAVIAALRVDESPGGPEVTPQPIWAEWNAKTPEAKAADALRADAALLDRMDALTADQRERFQMALGPLTLDFAGALRIRINEHVLHTWDIAVTFDPRATLPVDALDVVLHGVPLIAAFTGKPTGSTKEVRVHTTGPERQFVVGLSSSGVAVGPWQGALGDPDLVLPTEALIRLVYGRLDADHTPPFEGAPETLDELRRAFPGV